MRTLNRHSSRFEGHDGFTLLEVMVAMAILSLALVSLGDINAGAIAMHSYAKKLTVATFLAKSKMTEIESKLDLEGLPAENENVRPSEGNFEDEGFPQFKWSVEVNAPKSENLDPTKIMSLMMGGGSDPNAPPGGVASAQNPMAALLGGFGGAPAGGGAPGAAGAGGLGGLAGGMMAGPAQMMVSQITKMLREVKLTVTWENGKSTETFTVVEHIVSMGTAAAPPGANGVVQNAGKNTNPVTGLDE